jgi:hypothetical protein
MTDAIRSIGRIQWQATLLLAVVFGAGAAVGAAIDHTRSLAASPAPAPAPPPQGARRLPPWLERMNLSQDEHARIKAILEAQKPKIDTIMDGIMPRLRAISDTTFVQIRSALAPEHQTEFDRDRPVRELAPGMPGARGGEGPGREGRPGDGLRGAPPDGRGPPPDGRGPPRDGRGPPPERRPE